MSFKRSYYASGGIRTKKRKLGCVEHVGEGDDILAGITVSVYEALNYCRSCTNYFCVSVAENLSQNM